jgi:hypothetical protein
VESDRRNSRYGCPKDPDYALCSDTRRAPDGPNISQVAAGSLITWRPHALSLRSPLREARYVSKDDPLARLMQPISASARGDSDVINLQLRGGMPFKVIAKNRNWNRDFWNDLVGPTLREDMDDETWIRGKIPPIADSDGVHKTFDIRYTNLGALGVHWAWPESHDHAKWGITLHSDWVYMGDINRMVSQRKRGGGTIAFQNQVLWKALSQSSFLLAPPGSTRAQAHELISLTHPDPTVSAPPARRASIRKRAASKPTGRKGGRTKAVASRGARSKRAVKKRLPH